MAAPETSRSNSASLEKIAGLDVLPTLEEEQPRRGGSSLREERIQVVTLCWVMILIGWNCATLGPLLPRIQAYYNINYTIVSMLFVSQCVGAISGSFSSGYLTDKIGFGKLMTLGTALQLLTYPIMAAAPPFPVLCVLYVINGLAAALQDASCNIFVSSLQNNKAFYLGILHATFGFGALIAPLVATQFAQARHWSFHYITSASLALVNTILVSGVFRFRSQEHFMPRQDQNAVAQSSGSKYKEIAKMPRVHLMALFIFVYVGAEVTTGGWIFTFLLKTRNAGPSAGYVSSGFFGGLMVGRIILLPINKYLGPERVIFLYSAIAIALELTIWLVPNLLENAIAVSFVGVVFGPFYPILMQVASKTIPESIFAGSVGWIAAMGQTGSALFPFMLGALASRFGVQVLQPLAVAMMAALAIVWFLVLKSKSGRKETTT